MSDTDRGYFFVEPDHPVCSKCVSSLDRDDRCHECGGDGWVEVEDDDGPWGTATCPECFGLPPGWRCPTCKRHWDFHAVREEPPTGPDSDGGEAD